MLDKAKLRLLEKLDDWDQLEFTSPSEGANQKKQQLLEMARNGEPRPNQSKHLLGKALARYIDKNSPSYDAEFDEQVRKLAPHWFVSTASENKKILIEMARNGEPRPKHRDGIGSLLSDYLKKTGSSYDAEFDKQIRKLAPHWFIDSVTENKELLLDMAKRGDPKPIGNHSLANVFRLYTYNKSATYDNEFYHEIKKLRPEWIETLSEKVSSNKNQLLQMAVNGEARPIAGKHHLGGALNNYITKSCRNYDSDFQKTIFELRPDWFRNLRVENKKNQLLDMARNGEQRPNKRNHPLGAMLGHYINPNSESYDPEFDNQIRKLRPDWFKK